MVVTVGKTWTLLSSRDCVFQLLSSGMAGSVYVATAEFAPSSDVGFLVTHKDVSNFEATDGLRLFGRVVNGESAKVYVEEVPL